MELYVGTSGWSYVWNPDGFKWYARSSGLNAVELNASFYRFPFPSQVKGWSKQGRGLRWAVKVHRSITHFRKMGGRAFETWRKFKKLFEPLDDVIDFYLFQLPPSVRASEGVRRRVEVYAEELGWRLALEPRSLDWFTDEAIEWARELGITLVSPDSPEKMFEAYNTSGVVYARLHGRVEWYSYCYTREEIAEVLAKSAAAKPERIYVFFNNNHDMLHNARETLELGRGIGLALPGLPSSR
ncbi:MAG: DUF72 domain-containing protein [Thermoproteota archaeon]|nr:MAG: DUF72 domain-containing protein [Candidatus Korarchaeota archaeon]RLG51856.1 MAG: DUF72 domain-containing protein [Candidatus Korarchaeota archaeon]